MKKNILEYRTYLYYNGFRKYKSFKSYRDSINYLYERLNVDHDILVGKVFEITGSNEHKVFSCLVCVGDC